MAKERRTLAEMAAEAAGGSAGLTCPRCGCNDFRTYKTQAGTTATLRYKSCRHCGHRIITSSQVKERVVRDVDVRDDGGDAEDEGTFISLFG